MKKIGITNLIMVFILLVLCLLLLLGGLPGVISWAAIKLVLPFAGILVLLLHLAARLVKRIKGTARPPVARTIITVLLCGVYFFPILITMNIIPVAYPANVNTSAPALTAQWPFAEETVVAWGGNTLDKNLPHAMWGSERWAYDLVMEPYNTNSPDLESYGIWGKQVLCPVDGTVVAVHNSDRDIPPNQDEFESLEGNHVYIEVEESGTYLLLNHLKQGSVAVSVGDTVKPGDVLGRVGNSGTSSEPHLHVHHQRQNPTRTLYPLFAEGLPLYFQNSTGISMPEGGTIIQP